MAKAQEYERVLPITSKQNGANITVLTAHTNGVVHPTTLPRPGGPSKTASPWLASEIFGIQGPGGVQLTRQRQDCLHADWMPWNFHVLWVMWMQPMEQQQQQQQRSPTQGK